MRTISTTKNRTLICRAVVAISLALVLSVAMLSGCGLELGDPLPIPPAGSEEQNRDYAPGEMSVKFTQAAVDSAGFGIRENALGQPVTGLVSVDVLNALAGVSEITQAHPGWEDNPTAVRIGIHRWYRFKLPEDADIVAWATRYESDPNVEYADPRGSSPSLSLFAAPQHPPRKTKTRYRNGHRG